MPNQQLIRKTLYTWANDLTSDSTGVIDKNSVDRNIGKALDLPMFQDLRTLASGNYSDAEVAASGLPQPLIEGLRNRASAYIEEKEQTVSYLGSRMYDMDTTQVDSAMDFLNTRIGVQAGQMRQDLDRFLNRTQDMTTVEYGGRAIPIPTNRNRQFNWQSPSSALMPTFRNGQQVDTTVQELITNSQQSGIRGYTPVGNTTDKFGVPVTRFAKREWVDGQPRDADLSNSSRVAYYDLAYEADTNTFLWGKANSNSRHTINPSVEGEIKQQGIKEWLEPKSFRGTGDNFLSILSGRGTATNYGDDKALGSGALFNISTGTYDQLNDLGGQVAIPNKMRANAQYPYTVTPDDANRLGKFASGITHQSYSLIDDSKTALRNQTRRLSSAMLGMEVSIAGQPSWAKLFTSKGKDNQRAGFRGGSSGVGSATGVMHVDPMSDADGLYTSRVAKTGRSFERQQRFTAGFTSDRAGFGEGETRVKSGQNMITSLSSVPLDGYTMDNLPFRVGDIYTSSGRAPGSVAEGSRFVGGLESGGRIPGFSGWQAGNAQEVRIQGIDWDEETQRPIAHFARGNTADIGEIKTTSGLKGSNVGGALNDPHFMALEGKSGRSLDFVAPISSKSERWGDVSAKIFESVDDPRTIYNYMMAAGQGMTRDNGERYYNDDQLKNLVRYVDRKGNAVSADSDSLFGVQYDNDAVPMFAQASLNYAKDQMEDFQIRNKRMSELDYQAWMQHDGAAANILSNKPTLAPDGRVLYRTLEYDTTGLIAPIMGDWLPKSVSGSSSISPDYMNAMQQTQPEAFDHLMGLVERGALNTTGAATILKTLRGNTYNRDKSGQAHLTSAAQDVRKSLPRVDIMDIDFEGTERAIRDEYGSGLSDAQIQKEVLERLGKQYRGQHVQMGETLGLPINTLSNHYAVDDQQSQQKLGQVGYDAMRNYQSQYRNREAHILAGNTDLANQATVDMYGKNLEYVREIARKAEEEGTQKNAMRLKFSAPGGPARMVSGLPFDMKVMNDRDMQQMVRQNYKGAIGDEGVDDAMEQFRRGEMWGVSAMSSASRGIMWQPTRYVSDSWLRGDELNNAGFFDQYNSAVDGIDDPAERSKIAQDVLHNIVTDMQQKHSGMEGIKADNYARRINKVRNYHGAFGEFGADFFTGFGDVNVTEGTVGTSEAYIRMMNKDADGDNEAMNIFMPGLNKEHMRRLGKVAGEVRSLWSVGDEAGGTFEKYGNTMASLFQGAGDMLQAFVNGGISGKGTKKLSINDRDLVDSELSGARATVGMKTSYTPFVRGLFASTALFTRMGKSDEALERHMFDAAGMAGNAIYQPYMDKEDIAGRSARSLIQAYSQLGAGPYGRDSGRRTKGGNVIAESIGGLSPRATGSGISMTNSVEDVSELMFDMLATSGMQHDPDIYTGADRPEIPDARGQLTPTRGVAHAMATMLTQRKDLRDGDVQKRIYGALVDLYNENGDAGFYEEDNSVGNMGVQKLSDDARKKLLSAITGDAYDDDLEYKKALRQYTLGTWGAMKQGDNFQYDDAPDMNKMSAGSFWLASSLARNTQRQQNKDTEKGNTPLNLSRALGFDGERHFNQLADYGNAMTEANDSYYGRGGVEQTILNAVRLGQDKFNDTYSGIKRLAKHTLGTLTPSKLQTGEGMDPKSVFASARYALGQVTDHKFDIEWKNKGGKVDNEDMTIVGEDGPEILINGHVLPNSVYKEMFGGNSPQAMKGLTRQDVDYAEDGTELTPGVRRFLEQFPNASFEDLAQFMGTESFDGRNLRGKADAFDQYLSQQNPTTSFSSEPPPPPSMEDLMLSQYGSMSQPEEPSMPIATAQEQTPEHWSWQAQALRESLRTNQFGPAGHKVWEDHRSNRKRTWEAQQGQKWRNDKWVALNAPTEEEFRKEYGHLSMVRDLPSFDKAVNSLNANPRPKSNYQGEVSAIHNIEPISENEVGQLSNLMSRFNESLDLYKESRDADGNYTAMERPDFAKNVMDTVNSIDSFIARFQTAEDAGIRGMGGERSGELYSMIEALTTEDATAYSNSLGRNVRKESITRLAEDRRAKDRDSAIGGARSGEFAYNMQVADSFDEESLALLAEQLSAVDVQNADSKKLRTLDQAKQVLSADEYFTKQGVQSPFDQGVIKQIKQQELALKNAGFSGQTAFEANEGNLQYEANYGADASANVVGDFLSQIQELGKEIPRTTKEMKNYIGTFKQASEVHAEYTNEVQQLMEVTKEGGGTAEDKQRLNQLLGKSELFQQIGDVVGDKGVRQNMLEAQRRIAFDRFSDFNEEEKDALFGQMQQARGFTGRRKRAGRDYDELAKDYISRRLDGSVLDRLGLDTSGEKGTLARGAIEAIGGGSRLVNSLQGTMFSVMMANNQIMKPLGDLSERYQQSAMSRDMMLLRSGGGGSYGEMLDSEYGSMRRKTSRSELGQQLMGESIYNTYSGMVPQGAVNQLAPGAGSFIASAGGAAMSGMIAKSVFGSGTAGLIAGGITYGATQASQGMSAFQSDSRRGEQINRLRNAQEQNGILGVLGASIWEAGTNTGETIAQLSTAFDSDRRNAAFNYANMMERASDYLQQGSGMSIQQYTSAEGDPRASRVLYDQFRQMAGDELGLTNEQAMSAFEFASNYGSSTLNTSGQSSPMDIATRMNRGFVYGIDYAEMSQQMAMAQGQLASNSSVMGQSFTQIDDYIQNASNPSMAAIQARNSVAQTGRINQQLALANMSTLDSLYYTDTGGGSSLANNAFGQMADMQQMSALAQVRMQSADYVDRIAGSYSGFQQDLINSGQYQRSGEYASRMQQGAGFFNQYRQNGLNEDSATQIAQSFDSLAQALSKPEFDQFVSAISGDGYAMSQMAQRQRGSMDASTFAMYNQVDTISGRDPYAESISAFEFEGLQSFDPNGGLRFATMGNVDVSGGTDALMGRARDMQYGMMQMQNTYRRDMSVAGFISQTGGADYLNRGGSGSFQGGLTEGMDTQSYTALIDTFERLGDVSGPVADGMEDLAEIFDKYGFSLQSGRSQYDIEDEQRAMGRASQAFGMAQSTQSIGLDQQARDMRLRHFFEQMGFDREKLGFSESKQRTEMGIDRQRSLVQRGYQYEDWSFGRSKMDIGFAWNMEDFDRNLKYARGRDRVDLLRQQERAVISYSMDASKSDRDKGRLDETAQFEDERFERMVNYFEKEMEFSERALNMRERHFSEQFRLEDERFQMQQERHAFDMQQLQKQWALEDEAIEKQREWYQFQFEMSEAMSQMSFEGNDELQQINITLQGISQSAAAADAKLSIAMRNGTAFFDLMPQIGQGLQTITNQTGQSAQQMAITSSQAIQTIFNQLKTSIATLQSQPIYNSPNITGSGGFGGNTAQGPIPTMVSTVNQAGQTASGIISTIGSLKSIVSNVISGNNNQQSGSSPVIYGTVNGRANGGYIESLAASISPFARGGYTGDGRKYESAGFDLLELHKGEYVVPQDGALVLREGENMTAEELKEIRKLMQKLVDMGIYSVNAEIYTNERSMKASDLSPIDSIYQGY